MANANPQQLEERPNSRGIMERFITGQHVSVQALREVMPKIRPQDPMMRYLIKEIPPYPTPVKFWVSDVAHVTDESGYKGVLVSEEFRPPESEFSWWDLKINKEEIKAAEMNYMENHQNQAQELDKQEPFLEEFTTSPLFQVEKSRYGNYRFTFPLTDLMQWYKEQNCGGEEPVLRMYETITYKQEIVYTVLIHSPDDNERFGEYPLLEASDWVRYKDGEIIWKAQAICETHRYQFVSGEIQRLNPPPFYVWDQVSLVFHLPKSAKLYKTLKIPRGRLVGALEACKLHRIDLSGYQGPKNKEERFLDAKSTVSMLKGKMEEVEKEKECKDDIKMEADT